MADQNNQIFVSPFLNFDPSILVTNPEDQYLRLEGKDERSRFERSCCEIGGMVLSGGFLGGVHGLFKAYTDKSVQSLPSLSIKRVQILNHMTKQGGSMAQVFGTLGLIYAISDATIHYAGVDDDNMTTVAATTTTGLLYSSAALPQGWRTTIKGGGFGLGIGAVIVALSNLDRFKGFMGQIFRY